MTGIGAAPSGLLAGNTPCRILRRCYEADEGPPKCSLTLLRPDLSKEDVK